MKETGSFILTIIAILVLSSIVYFQFKSFKETPFEFSFPKIETPEFNISSTPENVEEKEFISSDGRLKLTYTTAWMALPLEEMAQQIDQQITTTDSQTLLSLQKFDLEKLKFSFLMAQKLKTGDAENAQDFFEYLLSQTTEEETEIIMSTSTDQILVFEANYMKNGSPVFHSLEKIIVDEENTYLISIIVPNQSWSASREEAENIVSSVQLIE